MRFSCFFFYLIFILLLAFEANAQNPILSSKAKISVITCGPGPSLYEAFGHSAIRVKDSILGYDLVFNYGVFDFNQPNFYGNFAKGYMRYMLGVSPFEEFLFQYKYYKRSVREQLLNLDSAQKQSIINYLSINLRPENREYYYAYFDNNCSTKIIELLDSALNHKIRWTPTLSDGMVSYRSLIHQYTVFQPWGRLGIDLGLGSKIDQPIAGKQFDFLPDFVENDIARARIGNEIDGIPLVSENKFLYQSDYTFGFFEFWTHPSYIFSIILFFSILTWLFFPIYSLVRKIWTGILFTFAGILGFVLALIWFFTNHIYAAWNFNILWANPVFLFLGISTWYWIPRFPRLAKGLVWYICSILVVWFFIPQDLNVNLLPLVAAMALSISSNQTSLISENKNESTF